MDAAVGIVLGLALVEYMWITVMTAQARGKYKIEAPATTGHPTFERQFRVQQNTVEQLVIFVPAILLFAAMVSANVAALFGLLFVLGRALYAIGYVAEPDKRATGFIMSGIATSVLAVGGLIGALAKLV